MTAATSPPPNAEKLVDKSGDRVRRMFGQIAERYDLLNHLLSLNVDRYWRWRTVRLVPPRTGQPILDLCTGTGDLGLAYNRAARGRVQIVGADFCHEMLVLARAKSQRRGATRPIMLIEADAQHLPFADDSFQIVCVAFGLRNVADTDRGMAEMVRVCASGGRVAVLEFSSPRRQPMKLLYGLYFRYVLPRVGQLVARNSECAYEYLPASVGQFLQYDQLADRLRAAGLINVGYYPFTLGIATLYVGEKP